MQKHFFAFLQIDFVRPVVVRSFHSLLQLFFDLHLVFDQLEVTRLSLTQYAAPTFEFRQVFLVATYSTDVDLVLTSQQFGRFVQYHELIHQYQIGGVCPSSLSSL